MDKEQKDLLVKAWQLNIKILREIAVLANMNEALAYGCIRTAETMVDLKMVARIRGIKDEEKTAKL